MRHSSFKTGAVTVSAAALLGGFGLIPARGQEPAPLANDHIQYNGLIDGYYLFQFQNPAGQGVITGRVYDIRHNTPTLALAELNVFQNARPGGLGFKATLGAGDTADLNGGAAVGTDASGNTVLVHNDSGEGRWKNLMQLYGTYSFGANGSGIDVGKFYTPFGYEVTEANADYNYSRSLAYTLVPFYHVGARLYTPVPGVTGLTATFFLVKALYNTTTAGVQDDNKKPAYIGQLNYAAPRGRFTLISTLGLGKDKLPNSSGPDTKDTVSDTDFTYNFNAAMLAGLDYTYVRLEPDGGSKTTTNGYAVYYRQQLTPRTAYALRVSGYTSKTDGGVPDTRPYEVTATYELKPAPNVMTRLEYRHDHVNAGNGAGIAYLDKDGNAVKQDQDTLTLAGIFTF